MPYIGAAIEDYIIANGLERLHSEATHVRICASEPNTYALAITSLGYKDWGAGGVCQGNVAATPTGRQVFSNLVTGGTVIADGTASWWAITDETNSRLHAHGPLQAPVQVFSGYTFSLPSFSIKMEAQ